VTDRLPTILVIDPAPATHELVFGALGDECTVLGARSRALAMTIAARRPPDVAILDDQLPELEELVADLRSLYPHARFLFLVASGRPRAEVAPFKALGSIITRPVDLERLRGVVRSAIRLGAMTAGVQRMRTGSFPTDKTAR
jgi:DNA-binding response OmpR family regulator